VNILTEARSILL